MSLSIEDLTSLIRRGLDVEASGRQMYRVFKPNDTIGNFVEGYESNVFGLIGDKLELIHVLNSPISYIFEADGKFHFMVWDYIPGPGPGDFDNKFANLEDCLNDAIQYYFGDPKRMNQKKVRIRQSKITNRKSL